MSTGDSGITPLTIAETAVQQSQAAREGYVKRVLIAFDQFVNVLFNGHPGETISARSARAATEGKLWGRVLSKFLDLFEGDHGAKAIAGDAERAQIIANLESSSKDINQ